VIPNRPGSPGTTTWRVAEVVFGALLWYRGNREKQRAGHVPATSSADHAKRSAHNSNFPATKSCLIHQSHLQQTFPPIPAHSLHHPANHESPSAENCLRLGPATMRLFPLHLDSPHHLTTFVPTRAPKQRETISERACGRTTRLMTSLRVSIAGIRENPTGQIHISMKRSSRLRCQRKNG
jgi:hypothetical protein